jgi:hypothetical protein
MDDHMDALEGTELGEGCNKYASGGLVFKTVQEKNTRCAL